MTIEWPERRRPHSIVEMEQLLEWALRLSVGAAGVSALALAGALAIGWRQPPRRSANGLTDEPRGTTDGQR